MTKLLPALAVVAVPAILLPPVQDQQVFRALGTGVTVEVAVLDGNTMVPGLSAADFELEDSGVRQTIEVLDVESLPIDLTIIVDVSGSMRFVVQELRSYVRDAGALLRLDDRIRFIWFASEVHDEFGLRPVTEELPLEKIVADGATAVYDALVAGLMRTRRGDRRQLIVAFSDLGDSGSWLGLDTLDIVARRSDSVLHVLLPVPTFPNADPPRRYDTRRYWFTDFAIPIETMGALDRAARATGGWVDYVYVREDLPKRLQRTLEDFRTSYVLRYRPVGVSADGWHPIAVRVPRSSYTVRHRAGYFAGGTGGG